MEEFLGSAIRDGCATYMQGDARDLAQITKGTKNVIEACIMCKVKNLIYTSSSGVVFDGVHGHFDVDESMPYPLKFIPGGGKNDDDFVFVDNIAHSHICAEKTLSTEEGAKIAGGQTYFITNMEPVNMWDFVSLIHEDLGYKRDLLWFLLSDEKHKLQAYGASS
ncbi:hypothetical protein BAE44_0001006 [Dichanthelium oligosanthes]|uniref:3-beta hydroxysteroid dehydrogenase/isomerase domain-containing protein n=1 Tax=Dichanthelium oligosanthes TaxID=888268 RepID=A0A1E5WKP4_9POAL|nr:hypothetical protein BAE44_0001006 [Dichanthelium oligosanthes]